MRWLAVSVVVPVLLVVSADITARGRAGSAALPLLAGIPAHAAEQNPSDFGCPAGQPATPSPGPGFVPTEDCNGWVPANHPIARRNGGASPAPSAPAHSAARQACRRRRLPGPYSVPTEDCQGWVPRNHPLAHRTTPFDEVIAANKDALFQQGKQIFRFDTFGDEAFWGDTLRLHEAIAGAANGGVGPGVSPAQALALGLKVDVNAVPAPVAAALRAGKLDLNDPANTIALLESECGCRRDRVPECQRLGPFDGHPVRVLSFHRGRFVRAGHWQPARWMGES